MRWASASIQVPEKPLLSLVEVAVAVGVHAKTVQRWVREGRFPAPKRVAGGKSVWTNLAVGVWLAWQDYAPDQSGGGESDPERAAGGGATEDDAVESSRSKSGHTRSKSGHPSGGG